MPPTSWKRAVVWSLIAAAFIGPGTVTTALRAGADGGLVYLPVVALAAAAGFLLMEMVARITVVTGRSLGAIVGSYVRWLPAVLLFAVVFGCAAYQAGNLGGAVAGLQLLSSHVDYRWILAIAVVVFGLLFTGNTGSIGRYLAVVVAAMGVLFLCSAVGVLATSTSVARAASTPVPGLIIGLFGTTIVPYNFFLAAGLGSGGGLKDMRRGLGGSFLIGAVITGSIVVAGSALLAFTAFDDAGRVLTETLGPPGRWVLGAGLFAAGLSSAITAPLAAALAGRELLAGSSGSRWAEGGTGFRLLWGGVLAVGVVVGLFQLNVVSVILIAQVINGLLVPCVGVLVLVMAGDRELMGQEVNANWQNLAGLALVLFLTYRSAQVLGGAAGSNAFEFPWIVTVLVGLLTVRLVYFRGEAV